MEVKFNFTFFNKNMMQKLISCSHEIRKEKFG